MTSAGTAPTLQVSVSASIEAHALRQPEKEALWCEGTSLSYGQLTTRAFSLSSAMYRLGIRRGDHIGVVLPNCMEFALLLIAAADLGAVLVPVSPGLPALALQRAFVAADVRHLVASRVILQQLQLDCPAFLATQRVLLSLESTGAQEVQAVEPAHSARLSLEDLTQPCSGAAALRLGRAEDAYILTMTSGSTGTPKPIVFEQVTKLNRAAATVALYGLQQDERILAATPLYHSLAQRLTLMPLLIGATAVILPRFSVKQWFSALVEQRVTFTIAVSSQLAQLARSKPAMISGAPALRCIVSSSALLEPSVKQQLRDFLQCAFHECYGTSETATATDLCVGGQEAPLQSVGRPLPGVKLRIVDAAGADVPLGEDGEILCSTPLLFAGYYKRPELTEQAMQDGYFRTGDVGCLDEKGYLYFRGRCKEVVITGGINVYPQDIEEVVQMLPWVAECAAFALPDANLGEVVGLAVVPKHGSEVDMRDLKLHCADALADYQQPRTVVVMHALPRNAMGKVVRQRLSLQQPVENGVEHA